MTTFTDPVVVDAGIATTNTPALDITQTWSGIDGGVAFTGIRADFTDTMSHEYNSRLVDLKLDGASIFTLDKLGSFQLANGLGSVGGIAVRGSSGEIAFTSQLHPSTGMPADVFRFYWEGGSAGNAAVLRGMGTNRLSIESAAAMVHIAQNSRYEWEGFGSPTINFTGYQAGSANGRPINFLNEGQTAEQATPIYATNVQAQVDTIQEWRDGRSGVTSTVAQVGADGTVTAKGLILYDIPTSDPSLAGQVWNDAGILKISAG